VESVSAGEAFLCSLGGRAGPDLLSRVPAALASLRGALAGALGGGAGPALHESLAVAALLPAGRAALREGPARAQAGFRVFKWKVAVGDARDEMAILDDLVGALPGGSRLRLDANGGWDARTAGRWLGHASGLPVEFVEQPVAPGSRGADDTLMGLSADYPVPVALDESIACDADALRWLDAGWRGYFVVKAALMGEPEGTLGRLARAGARVVFSSALETAIGARSALRAAFAWPGERAALGFGVWPLFADSRFDGPAAAPHLRRDDAERVDPEALWNAVS
jgi:O-succinylbenzoate synthase